jgi:hypothetical protein
MGSDPEEVRIKVLQQRSALDGEKRSAIGRTAPRQEEDSALPHKHAISLAYWHRSGSRYGDILRLIEEPRNLLTLRANRIRLGCDSWWFSVG